MARHCGRRRDRRQHRRRVGADHGRCRGHAAGRGRALDVNDRRRVRRGRGRGAGTNPLDLLWGGRQLGGRHRRQPRTEGGRGGRTERHAKPPGAGDPRGARILRPPLIAPRRTRRDHPTTRRPRPPRTTPARPLQDVRPAPSDESYRVHGNDAGDDPLPFDTRVVQTDIIGSGKQGDPIPEALSQPEESSLERFHPSEHDGSPYTTRTCVRRQRLNPTGDERCDRRVRRGRRAPRAPSP